MCCHPEGHFVGDDVESSGEFLMIAWGGSDDGDEVDIASSAGVQSLTG